jgi:oxygen-dependent protoporphyrinogen oxidase
LFSRRGQLRIALEPWIPRRKGTDDESLGSLLGRRFGRELVDRLAQPLLGGIYGGDIDRLGVGATFPDLARMESESGSLVRAARARPAPDTQSGGPFVSLKGGTQQLVDALIGALGDDVVRTNQRVVGLGTRSGATGTAHAVTTEDGAVMDCDDVVLAIPAPAAVALVHGVAPHVARALAGLAHASTAVVSLGFREGDVGRALDGYGFLVAKDEATPIRGCTWSSTKFPGRAPAGHVLVRAFVGGSGREGEVALDEGALVAAALEALRPLLDLRGAPVMTQVARWPAAQPQYETGHKDRVAHIRSARPAGVHLLGASYDGVGVPACVDAGRKLGTALSVETTGPPLD